MNLLLRYMVVLCGLLILGACSSSSLSSTPDPSETVPASGFEGEVVPINGVATSATAPRLLIRANLKVDPIPFTTQITKFDVAGQATVIWGDLLDPMKGTITVSLDGYGSTTETNTDHVSTPYYKNQPRGRYCVSVTWNLHSSKYASVRTTPVTNCQWATLNNLLLLKIGLSSMYHGYQGAFPSLPLQSVGDVTVDFDIIPPWDNSIYHLPIPVFQRPVFWIRQAHVKNVFNKPNDLTPDPSFNGLLEFVSATMDDGQCTIHGGIVTCISNNAVPYGYRSIHLKVKAIKPGISGVVVYGSSTTVLGFWEDFSQWTSPSGGEQLVSMPMCLGTDFVDFYLDCEDPALYK